MTSHSKTVLAIIGFITGSVFLLSGFGKLPHIAVFQSLIAAYGIASLSAFGPLIVVAEIMLGIVLVLGVFRKQAAMLSFYMALIFTIAYTYGYRNQGIVECGCFGNILGETRPLWVYARNLVLLVLLGYLSIYATDSINDTHPLWKRIVAWGIIIPSVFIAGMTSYLRIQGNPQHPFIGRPTDQTVLAKYINKKKDKTLLTFMSPNCPHCINSVENYLSFMKRGWVDTGFCYILSMPDLNQDSLFERLHLLYPEISWNELPRDSISFIEAFPTTFLIENDTIRKVIIGEIPSPLLLLGDSRQAPTSNQAL
ncbi:MAG: DoxX family protein [Bacteroides sp.]|nr:DoxX family protein [Bacteroides sp.]MCM1086168.1 DoxX family protein [Bacteroides sp.]